MRKIHLLCVFLIVLLSGCSGSDQSQVTSFFAMDTAMEFTIYGEESLLKDAQELVCGLEAEVSATDENSTLYAINQTGHGILTDAAGDLLERTLALCRRTGGALDISIYPVVRAWGFTTGTYQIPEAAALHELLSHVDYREIRFDAETGAVSIQEGMRLDLGSTAKGYAGSLAAEYLRENGVNSALLSLGGNVQTVGGKPDGAPWKIGVKDPRGGTPMMVLSVQDQAVVTSGGYERYFEQDGRTYWHIIDPSTGYPAESGLISVTVVGADGLVCDGLSTALFVMGLERAAALWQESADFEAVFMTQEGELYITAGLTSNFALTEDHQDMTVRVIQR